MSSGRAGIAYAIISIISAAILAVWQPRIAEAVVDDYVGIQFLTAWSFAFITATLMHRTLVTPYVLFLITTLFFLGGRFIADQFGLPHDVFADKSFRAIRLNSREAVELMSYVSPILLTLHAGYIVYWWRRKAEPTASPDPTAFSTTLWIPAAILVAICTPLALLGAFNTYQISISGQYSDIYLDRTEFATRWTVLAQYGLLLALGLAFASQRRSLEILSVTVLALLSIATLGIGIRSGFLSFLILLIWLVHNRIWRVNVFLASAAFMAMLFVAIASASFSARTSTAGSKGSAANLESRLWHLGQNTSPQMLLYFIRNQGTTLLSIHVATKVDHYPWQAYVQTFAPGFGAVASLAGAPYQVSDLYFGQHMAKTWMPANYERGEGFGWSFISDLIVFSGKNKILMIGFATALGFLLAMLTDAATTSPIWFGALAVLMPKIALLPRTGLYSIFPYLFVYLGAVAAWWALQKIIYKKDIQTLSKTPL